MWSRGARTHGVSRTLVLWDIDHTLVDIGGLGREIYAAVFSEVTGHPLERVADMTGRTDRAIVTDTLRLHGIEATEDTVTAFANAVASAFATRDGEIRIRGRALPGAKEALEAIAGTPDVVQSVLTGNMASIAVGKLTAFEMNMFIDFDVGAYGLDDVRRPPLVQLARRRAAEKYGAMFDSTSTVLVGDTPHDVRAGHEGGARVVAVATGSSDEKTLRSAGADVVLPDLADTNAVVRAVLGVSAN